MYQIPNYSIIGQIPSAVDVHSVVPECERLSTKTHQESAFLFGKLLIQEMLQ